MSFISTRQASKPLWSGTPRTKCKRPIPHQLAQERIELLRPVTTIRSPCGWVQWPGRLWCILHLAKKLTIDASHEVLKSEPPVFPTSELVLPVVRVEQLRSSHMLREPAAFLGLDKSLQCINQLLSSIHGVTPTVVDSQRSHSSFLAHVCYTRRRVFTRTQSLNAATVLVMLIFSVSFQGWPSMQPVHHNKLPKAHSTCKLVASSSLELFGAYTCPARPLPTPARTTKHGPVHAFSLLCDASFAYPTSTTLLAAACAGGCLKALCANHAASLDANPGPRNLVSGFCQ